MAIPSKGPGVHHIQHIHELHLDCIVTPLRPKYRYELLGVLGFPTDWLALRPAQSGIHNA